MRTIGKSKLLVISLINYYSAGIYKIDEGNNIYLNGCSLTLEHIVKLKVFIKLISGNIYLKDNQITGIPDYFIGNYEGTPGEFKSNIYKSIHLEGNPIAFKIDSARVNDKPVKLVSIQFLSEILSILENENPSLYDCICNLAESTMKPSEIPVFSKSSEMPIAKLKNNSIGSSIGVNVNPSAIESQAGGKCTKYYKSKSRKNILKKRKTYKKN